MIRITESLLLYHDRLELRDTASLDLVVLHCTELPTLAMAREFGERIQYPEPGTGTSGHYYIDRDGSVWRYVQDDRMANHVVGFNRTSLGIELVNTGRYPCWFHAGHQAMTEPYAGSQIKSLRELLIRLRERYPGLIKLARHSDLDTQTMPAEDDPSTQVRRRIDPGPLFPWEDIRAFWESLPH